MAEWNVDHGYNSRGSVVVDDPDERAVVKLNLEQVSRFNDWVDMIFDMVKGLPRDQVVEDDQSSIWPHMKGQATRSTLPLHNQVIDILQKAWKDPKRVIPFGLEAFALLKIKEDHHERFTQPRVSDRFVALSVKGPTAAKVLSSSFPKLLD